MIDSATLHRGAKYFMDSGRVTTHDEAMALMRSFGLTIHVGKDMETSELHQIALLSLINTARRSFLAGVEVVGLADIRSLTRLAGTSSLKRAVKNYGARVVDAPNAAWPSALIGCVAAPSSALPSWRLTWSGWRGGAIPARDDALRQNEASAITLAPILAAACCAAETFAYHAQDHVMAGRRPLGLSLWKPGVDWLAADPSEPALSWLPSQLWIIGLGNLGQAFAWAIAALPYADTRAVKLVLQDDDRLAASNDSTSLLSFLKDVGQRKARKIGAWLDSRGFETFVRESRFGLHATRADDDPAVALCGVDNALARAALEKPGFGLVVEAGLGAGPEAFRSLSLHTFPSSRAADAIWSKQVGSAAENVENMPAYRAMKKEGMDACGLTQLASRTVGVPFVGLIASMLVFSELLRRLNGGVALELVSASVAALDAIESVPFDAQPYAFGHVSAANLSTANQRHLQPVDTLHR